MNIKKFSCASIFLLESGCYQNRLLIINYKILGREIAEEEPVGMPGQSKRQADACHH
jgi:hypothetical protein